MPGTYSITENKTDNVKFRAMVSFNGNPAEYWEHDSLDAESIDAALQATADAAAKAPAEPPVISIRDGKIVL